MQTPQASSGPAQMAMWVGKSIFTRTIQRALALIGPEIRSVQSAFRLGPKDVPFLTGQKGDGKSRTNQH